MRNSETLKSFLPNVVLNPTICMDRFIRTLDRVSLARRNRRAYGGNGQDTGVHYRLHFRRGHWSHYSNPGAGEIQFTDEGYLRSKSWINWMLVGDPDPGFVDKHYKL